MRDPKKAHLWLSDFRKFAEQFGDVVGRHASVAIFDAPTEVSLLKITAPFSNFGVAHIVPAMLIEDAILAW